MPSVIMQSVVMLNVAAPNRDIKKHNKFFLNQIKYDNFIVLTTFYII